MVLQFLCPNGHKVHCSEERAGQPAKCPRCGIKFRIPSIEELQLTDATDSATGSSMKVGSASGSQSTVSGIGSGGGHRAGSNRVPLPQRPPSPWPRVAAGSAGTVPGMWFAIPHPGLFGPAGNNPVAGNGHARSIPGQFKSSCRRSFQFVHLADKTRIPCRRGFQRGLGSGRRGSHGPGDGQSRVAPMGLEVGRSDDRTSLWRWPPFDARPIRSIPHDAAARCFRRGRVQRHLHFDGHRVGIDPSGHRAGSPASSGIAEPGKGPG